VIYEEEDAGNSRLLAARARMQQKYLAQFDDLYEDFHLARPSSLGGRPAPSGLTGRRKRGPPARGRRCGCRC